MKRDVTGMKKMRRRKSMKVGSWKMSWCSSVVLGNVLLIDRAVVESEMVPG
jgi:hypothetical protein